MAIMSTQETKNGRRQNSRQAISMYPIVYVNPIKLLLKKDFPAVIVATNSLLTSEQSQNVHARTVEKGFFHTF